MTEAEFQDRLKQLHHDINEQGARVADLATRAFDAVFDANADLARQVAAEDDEINRTDIEIERSAVALLSSDVASDRSVRMVLTIVKVNNELERIADLAADIAEQVVLVTHVDEPLPATMRVMVNSVLGMIRDSQRTMRDLDVVRARAVLASDDLVEEFKTTIMREAQEFFATGKYTIDFVLAMWRIAAATNRMAAHTTNICEQVIYVESGQIVRHSAGGWSDPTEA